MREMGAYFIDKGLIGQPPDPETRFRPSPDAEPPTTLRERVLPSHEYPDPTVVDKAPVLHVVGVLPWPPEQASLQFTVGTNVGEGTVILETLTGEGWQTERSKLLTRGAMWRGMPSRTAGMAEASFSMTREQALGTERRAEAEAEGREASTSIVLIAKPILPQGQAVCARMVIRWLRGECSVQEVAQAALRHRAALNPFKPGVWFRGLQAQGRLTEAQVGEIEGAIEGEETAQKEREAVAAALSRSSSWDTGGVATSMGGSNLLRSPLHGSGERGHTGEGGATGARYTAVTEKFEPDPFQSPRILVVHPFGIQGMQPGFDRETATAALANVLTLQKGGEADAR
jgi:hypothetical protein